MEIQKIAAFTSGNERGNPTGIVLCDTLPTSDEMQDVTTAIGF